MMLHLGILAAGKRSANATVPNDTIAALNRLNVRYTMAVRCSNKGINDAIAAIPAELSSYIVAVTSKG